MRGIGHPALKLKPHSTEWDLRDKGLTSGACGWIAAAI